MKNVKDQVYAALDAVFENVTDQYPKDWAALPAVQYTEEDNKVYERTDKEEKQNVCMRIVSICIVNSKVSTHAHIHKILLNKILKKRNITVLI